MKTARVVLAACAAGLFVGRVAPAQTPGAGHYLVVDLSGGPDAERYPVHALRAPPPGGWTDEFKTDRLVLRQIPPGAFTQGAPAEEAGRLPGETQRRVEIRQAFYIGIFPVTQAQWNRVMGNWPSFFRNPAARDTRPVEQVAYLDLRGAGQGNGWPAHDRADPDSFLGRLRARTGGAFDLPTEAQWEYAARAGRVEALNTGHNLGAADRCPHLSEAGRYRHNQAGGVPAGPDAGPAVGTAPVGSYLPNAWGLYDVHGNVFEWCLDWHAAYPVVPESDPVGPASGTTRVIRGGGWGDEARHCRAAFRHHLDPALRSNGCGFRVAVVPGAAGSP